MLPPGLSEQAGPINFNAPNHQCKALPAARRVFGEELLKNVGDSKRLEPIISSSAVKREQGYRLSLRPLSVNSARRGLIT